MCYVKNCVYKKWHTLIENFGIGIDIVEINRFKKIPYDTKKPFYNKIFQPREITYCLKFSDSYRHFAGKFAIKEALNKSIREEVDFLEIETDHSHDKPTAKLKNDKKTLSWTSKKPIS